MVFNYAKMAAVAIAQIADKGRAATLTYKTQGTYSPASDSFAGQSETTQTVKMVITDINKREVDETLIKTGDRIGLLAPDNLSAVPKVADEVIDDNGVYTIKRIEQIKPGNTILLYKLLLRFSGLADGNPFSSEFSNEFARGT